MSDPLEGPRLKVERANKQIVELEGLIMAFNADHPYEFFTENDLVNKHVLYKCRATKEVPATIKVIAGECLASLRSALDQVFYSVSTRGKVELIERPGFPIEKTEKEFEAKLLKRKIDERLPLVSSLLRELKPYKAGNPLLWRLHYLNSMDKHRAVVPIGRANIQRSYQLQLCVPRDGLQIHFVNNIEPLDKEPTLFFVDSEIQVKGEIEVGVDVAFSEVDGGKIEPVIATLQQCADMTSGIITAFQERFFGSLAP